MTDYRQLLVRYMANVLSVEGVTFIDNGGYDFSLTKEEQAELHRIAIEAKAHNDALLQPPTRGEGAP